MCGRTRYFKNGPIRATPLSPNRYLKKTIKINDNLREYDDVYYTCYRVEKIEDHFFCTFLGVDFQITSKWRK